MVQNITPESIVGDSLSYIIKCRENFQDIIDKTAEGNDVQFEVVLKALKDLNLFITECLLMENYLKSESIGLSNKNKLSQVVNIRQQLQLFNSSLTAILRAITLMERYKNDTGQLIEIERNKYGILYKDETSDCYLLFHLRSGWLQRFNFPYLTRSENQDLALEMFGKMKHIENTN